jgi:DNA-binding NarL/FixJ family response regulator
MIAEQKIKIMMAEDHASARQAYVALLQEEPNFMVTGHAANGYELLKLVEEQEPHIVITDLDMPVMNGSKLIEVLRARFPKVRPIVLSMHDEAEFISQLILHGACAYLPKACHFEEVVFTINKVYEEGYYFNPFISRVIMSSNGAVDHASKDMGLSPREIDVLRLICMEKSNNDIARLLNISINTVSSYRQNIFRKTESGSVIGLYKYALKNGVVEGE